jgi:peptidoglycan/LPS O-acetylase OafA/YrhL
MADGRIRLAYLDGVRGLAALFVVVHHVYIEVVWKNDLPRGLISASRLLYYGQLAVAVFIVLSGYSLMLPVARSANGALPGGLGGYLRRRARRILPPYFAALALTLALIALVPAMRHPTGFGWNMALPVSRGAILSHLFLVHNLNPYWTTRLNPPMWSVATEWQIYFLFPLLLLPLARRVGIVSVAIVAYLAGAAMQWWAQGQLSFTAPWYVGLFACGMGAALVGFSAAPIYRAMRRRVSLSGVGLPLFIGLATLTIFLVHNRLAQDGLAGVATAALLIGCTQRCGIRTGAWGVAMGLLESRPVVWLGTISYSLYLIHFPLITLAHLGVRHFFGPDPWRRLALLPPAVALIVVPVTYVFHRIFERPFMAGSPRTREKIVIATALEPAP